VTHIRWTTEAASQLEALVNRIREDNPEAARTVAPRVTVPVEPQWCSAYTDVMASQTKTRPRVKTSRAVRQSVTVPAPVATEVRRIAKERHVTISRALVALAERGIQAERDAKENLRSTYKTFMDEKEPARKEEAAKDLVRAIFGKDAIAEDPFL